MAEALALVKRELGPEAVILGTRDLTGERMPPWARKLRVEISAAPPGVASPAPRVRATRRPLAAEPAPAPLPPTGAPPRPDVPEQLYPYYVELIKREVAHQLAEHLVRQVSQQLTLDQPAGEEAIRAALRQQVERWLPAACGLDIPAGKHHRVALVGPPGAGKTTTLAKLAAEHKLRQGRRVGLLSLDAHRLDAAAQLRRFAELLEVPCWTAQTIADVKTALEAARDLDLLLIDTPGIGPRDQGRFARVASLLRAARPDETHLVTPASLAPGVQTRLAQGFAPLGASRLILTRLDEVVGIGVVLNIVDQLKLGVSYLTTGQNVPQDLQVAGPRALAEILVPAHP